MTKLGAQVSVAGPATLLPPFIGMTGAKVYSTVQEALIDADVIIVLRIQKERQHKGLFPTIREYARFFGLDEKRLQLAKEDAIILHPGPINRGIELTTSVAESEQSFIDEQVTNGVAIRMALLYLLTRRSGTNEAIN
jgi:aspartate carbamoyltransferase catalytic subunit